MRHTFFIIIAFLFIQAKAQVVYQEVTNTRIYSFIDELANEKIISLQSCTKPYARKLIAQKLQEAQQQQQQLTKRQQKELQFYLNEYDIERDTLTQPFLTFINRSKNNSATNFSTASLRYTDSLFKMSIRPIFGYQVWNNQNGSNYHRWNGIEAFAYAGKLGMYASLRDNHQGNNKQQLFSNSNYLSNEQAAVYKSGDDFSEMRGGITYAWKWGHLALVKDYLQWGNHYHYPSIFSTRPPSYTQLKWSIKPVKWFEFNYVHARLVSSVIDSSKSYTISNAYDTSGYRDVFHSKYYAANLFTFHPFSHTSLSFGNSIIYGDLGIEPTFLIPFLLYKSTDHTLIGDGNSSGPNSRGQNSQLFIDFSFREIKHLHLYATVFFEDLAIGKIKDPEKFNLYSLNTGIHISNLVPNTFVTFEYFKSMPLVYKHDFPVTTFETNQYNLGHYLTDNSEQYFFSAGLKPLKNLWLTCEYARAKHGLDHTRLGTTPRDGIPFMQQVDWQRSYLKFYASYQVVFNTYIFIEYVQQQVTGNVNKYTAPYYHSSSGKTRTLSFGINYGF